MPGPLFLLARYVSSKSVLRINSLTLQQSVSQTLHTSTASIFTPLLDYYLSTSSNTNTTYTLIRRSLTALIHHVKNAEQFELLGDLIVQNFFDILKSTDISSESDIERLRKMIEVVGVVRPLG